MCFFSPSFHATLNPIMRMTPQTKLFRESEVDDDDSIRYRLTRKGQTKTKLLLQKHV
jgi:hypothetical protein